MLKISEIQKICVVNCERFLNFGDKTHERDD